MATTEYKPATTTNRNAQTPINRTSGDRNEVGNNTAIWIIVAIVALAAIAFAMGLFGSAENESMPTGTMASTMESSDTANPMTSGSETSAAPGTPDTVQTNVAPSQTPSAVQPAE